MSRHRRSIKDLSLILLIMLVATFYAWQVDVFANEGHTSAKEQTIEVDELLLLGGVLMLALLVFAIRRYLEQKRETGRRVAAEKRARELRARTLSRRRNMRRTSTGILSLRRRRTRAGADRRPHP